MMQNTEKLFADQRPIHPVIYDLGMRFPELSYRTFKDKKHCYIYDNRTLEGSMTPIAKLVRSGVKFILYIKGNRVYKGSAKNCLDHVHRLMQLGVIKDGKIC